MFFSSWQDLLESSFYWSYELYFSDSVPETIRKTDLNKNECI